MSTLVRLKAIPAGKGDFIDVWVKSQTDSEKGGFPGITFDITEALRFSHEDAAGMAYELNEGHGVYAEVVEVPK